MGLITHISFAVNIPCSTYNVGTIIDRMAKAKMDDQPFFSNQLHICYAPEYESVEETRQKLQERRKVIARKTRGEYKVTTLWCGLTTFQ